MSLSAADSKSGRGEARRFATTHWSIVVAAGRRASPQAREALATLCQVYWYPLYAYVRRQGHSANDAQDLTQEFFVQLLERNYVGTADRMKGKFRSFLLASLKHFLAKEWRRAGTQKRGGGRCAISLDLTRGESRYTLEPAHELTAEKIYERRWALTLLEQTLAKLRDEFVGGEKLRASNKTGQGTTKTAGHAAEQPVLSGAVKLFEHLKAYLGGAKSTVPYQQIAAQLGMTEGAVKVAVHRLRRRCRELLRAEIAQTVARPEEVDEELRDLFKAVGQ